VCYSYWVTHIFITTFLTHTHTHTPLSLALSHTQSFTGGRFEWSSELPLEFLLWFQFSDALISFSFYCWSQRSCEGHTGECAYKHTRRLYCCGLNEILLSAVCCYLFEIKRATSASLVITQHGDRISWDSVRADILKQL